MAKQYTPQEVAGYEHIGSQLPELQKWKALESKIQAWMDAGSPSDYTAFGIPDADSFWNDLGIVEAPTKGQLADLFGRARNSRLWVDDYEKFKAPPEVDTRMQDLQKAQIESAKRFRDSIPLYAKELMAKPEQDARRGLAEKMVGIAEGANSRGLLYGGQPLKASADAKEKSAEALSGQRSQLNTQLSDVADTMASQAKDTGFAAAGLGQDQYSAQQSLDKSALEQLLKQQAQKNQGLSDLFGVAGQAGGKVAANL